MDKVTVFVGLDYHSKSVQVCVMDQGGAVLSNRSCGNSVAEIAAVVGPDRTVARAAVRTPATIPGFAMSMSRSSR